MNANAAEEMNAVKPEHLVNALKKGSSAGPDGLPPLLLMELIKDDDLCRTVLADLATRMARGKLPPRYAQIMASGAAFALEKPGSGKIRPICITPILRRAVASVLARRIGSCAAQWMAPHQHACDKHTRWCKCSGIDSQDLLQWKHTLGHQDMDRSECGHQKRFFERRPQSSEDSTYHSRWQHEACL